ncbi:hypothetical protein CKM354_000806200 [Cercospora kikuchii]|uniref:Peptidase M48 domain-containing protein n=1 Tax=Cercospora kikuchii TaxID=84275 RepID=A0A9P3CLF6_9PEZI|nr:metalloendopeptidase [Cercospora kikuchii]GIZ44876.1 hypothetical protein CKM354_000806200 [Cercospora kikuchii]
MASQRIAASLRTLLRTGPRNTSRYSTPTINARYQPVLRASGTFRQARPTAKTQWHDIYRSAQRNAFSSASRTRPRSNTNWQRTWQQHNQQKRQYARPMFNQSQFQMASTLLRRWAARPTFYYEVAFLSGGVVGIYIYNLETVAVSGRKRFNIISPETEKKMGKQSYQQVIQEYGRQIMSPNSKEHRMVERVLQRLLPHCGLEDEEWEVHVINDDMKNAFVVPGGKVFVFRGILDVCQGDDGLAAVLGHEIAHNVAHHAAERMSQSAWMLPLVLVGWLFGIDPNISGQVGQIAFSLPGSRSQEQEADYIGLLMMAESCFDPHAAVGLWERMEAEEKRMGGAPPQFMSTHPSSHNRMEQIREWLPKAEAKMDAAGCSNVKGYLGGFTQAADLERFGMSGGGGRWG